MQYDLVVVGGGPVGASIARAVPGLRVALLSQERRSPVSPRREDFDSRVYALSPGNVGFLRGIGAWDRLPPERLAPVHAMRIFGDDGASAIEFDAYDVGVPELAWIVEDGALQDALWAALEIEPLAPAACDRLVFRPEQVQLTLQDGRELSARLVVGADGANSFVRSQAGIHATEREYGQSAVVANFQCATPHANIAYQWFSGGPVLAFLPLPGDQVSMVWSLPTSEAQRILALAPEPLCRELETASRDVLGTLKLAAAPRSYVLRRLSSARLVAPRLALAGDAGHVIHPLAGQGLNLGLQDARELARVLAQREPQRDPGDLRLLRRYERSRAEPLLAMDAMVDQLFHLFAAKGEKTARLRNAGLNFAGRVEVLKNLLVRHAMS